MPNREDPFPLHPVNWLNVFVFSSHNGDNKNGIYINQVTIINQTNNHKHSLIHKRDVKTNLYEHTRSRKPNAKW